MYTFSVDIGTANFAYCLFDASSILLWDNVNLTSRNNNVNNNASNIDTCTNDNNNKCSMCCKNGNYTYNNSFFCIKHARTHVTDTIVFLPKELNMTQLSKKTLPEIKKILKTHNVNIDFKLKKANLLESVAAYIKNSLYILPVVKVKKQSQYNGSSNIINICRNLTNVLDNIVQKYPNIINHVIVENQMKAKMKMVQSMVIQYFMKIDSNINFQCISASNKLKLTESIEYINKHSVNNNYKNRKNVGVDICFNILESNAIYDSWKTYPTKYNKKDDISDCFLQGLWYIRQHSI